ncbi:DUF2256 domain-containing protein [Aliivibrio fischeri]|uniref:DUF2256 domain-containing protein n=2 Tax=Aliivibrio fischeri TaxID=668 RepID=A0A6N3Z3K8_ALIFS|nr:DUF2256 domain-containing protein [Aliivibrio fischeri]MUK44125.1 DUF2256 domain-containing protein [Aliivibrio fischeri]MUK80292.1 DUF2256 domain-containing protein [Aliivibrio fischeri]MUK85196.1 DUF2256 domain-containing protein [Aliivibrio fischeri]
MIRFLVSSDDVMESKMKKSELPEKICVVCQRPFSWRKKWERDWPMVKYCSKRCRSSRHQSE